MTKAEADKMLYTIHQAVVGNGVKGLSDRMNEVEDYIKDHPRICPLEKRVGDIWKIRAVETAIIGLLLTVIQIVMRVLKIL